MMPLRRLPAQQAAGCRGRSCRTRRPGSGRDTPSNRSPPAARRPSQRRDDDDPRLRRQRVVVSLEERRDADGVCQAEQDRDDDHGTVHAGTVTPMLVDRRVSLHQARLLPHRPCAGWRSRPRATRPRSRAGSAAEVEAAIRRLSACSSTRSRPSSAATGSRSPRASAPTAGHGPAAARAAAACSSTGRTRRACSRSRTGRSSPPDAGRRPALVRRRRPDPPAPRGRDPGRDP